MPNLPGHFFPCIFGTTDSGELALMLPMIIPIGLGALRRTGPSNVTNDNFYLVVPFFGDLPPSKIRLPMLVLAKNLCRGTCCA